MFKAACGASAVKSGHHLVLLLADSGFVHGHEENRDDIGGDHLLTLTGRVGGVGFAHVDRCECTCVS